MQYKHRQPMVSREVGEELTYPSLPAALLTAAIVLLLSRTMGMFLMDMDAVEWLVREWTPFLQPFMDALPSWAREAPLIFGSIAVGAIVVVRLLAGILPSIALYLMTVAVACAIALVAPPTRLPAVPQDWVFVCYVILTAFVGGAPRPYEDQI